MKKPKVNRAGDLIGSSLFDRCQTPPYAIEVLIPYLNEQVVWESACGDGDLARALQPHCRKVIATDVLQSFNYFDCELPAQVTRIVTNPPYSIKYEWLARTVEFGVPFALLMPVEMLGAATAQKIFRQGGIEIIFLDHRVNFKMPTVRKWKGSSAQFPTCWYTRGLGIGRENTFAEITPWYPEDDPGPDPCFHSWIYDDADGGYCEKCSLSYSDYVNSGWDYWIAKARALDVARGIDATP